MKKLALIASLALAAATPMAPTAAKAADSPNACFRLSQWQGWSAPEPDMLYLKIGNRDVYRVGLREGSPKVDRRGGTFLVSEHHDSTVCSPIELQLRIADQFGERGFLIATSITKLTPEEVAKIPKKDLP